MIITLERYAHCEFGTFGKLTAGDLVLQTVEQDWENNMPNVSCVPNGRYLLQHHISPHHGACYILSNQALGIGKNQDDAKRFGCLIHKANLASQLEGCIAPGLSLGYYKSQWAVLSSGAALSKLFSVLGSSSSHELFISSNFPSFIEE